MAELSNNLPIVPTGDGCAFRPLFRGVVMSATCCVSSRTTGMRSKKTARESALPARFETADAWYKRVCTRSNAPSRVIFLGLGPSSNADTLIMRPKRESDICGRATQNHGPAFVQHGHCTIRGLHNLVLTTTKAVSAVVGFSEMLLNMSILRSRCSRVA